MKWVECRDLEELRRASARPGLYYLKYCDTNTGFIGYDAAQLHADGAVRLWILIEDRPQTDEDLINSWAASKDGYVSVLRLPDPRDIR